MPVGANAWHLGAIAPTGITLTDVPAAGFVFNRSQGATSGQPFMSGTYAGGLPYPEAQVRLVSNNNIVAAWTPLVNLTQVGGVWSGRGPAVPQSSGLIYKYEVRCRDNHALTAAGSNGWDVGVNILFTGQSNCNSLCANSDSTVVASANTFHITRDANNIPDYRNASFVSCVVTPWGNGGQTILNALTAALGCSVCGLNMSVNATNIDFDYGAWFDGDTTGAVKLWFGGDFELMLFNGGENNFQYNGGSTLTPRTYLDWVITGQSKAQTLTGRSVMPLFITSIGRNTDPTTPAGTTNWPDQQRTYVDAGNIIPNVYFSGDNMDCTTSDFLHEDAPSCTRHGQRAAQSILFYRGLSATKQSPWFATAGSITSATTTTITLVHSAGTDFTPTTNISGFEVSQDGLNWITATGARSNATTVLLTHSSLGTTFRLWRHQWDVAPPLTGMIHDNSTIASPLNYTPVPLPCTNNTSPYAVVQPGSAQTLVNSGGSTFTCIEQMISANAGDRLVLSYAMGTGQPQPSSITITPAGGSTINLTKIVGTDNNGGSIWWTASALASPISLGVKCTIVATWAVGNFTVNGFMVYVIPGSLGVTNSLVATPSASPTPPSGSLTVAAGGIIIGNTLSQSFSANTRNQIATLTGGNGFVIDTGWAPNVCSPQFGFCSSFDNTSGSKTISMNFVGTSGTATLVAASFA